MPQFAIKYTGLRGVPAYTIIGNNTGAEREAVALSAADLNAMGVGGNPFDQSLNVADSVEFENVVANSFSGDGYFTGTVNIGDGSSSSDGLTITTSGGTHGLRVSSNTAYLTTYNKLLIRNNTTTVFDTKGGSYIGSSVPSLGRGVVVNSLGASYEALVVKMNPSQSVRPVKLVDSSDGLVSAFDENGSLEIYNSYTDGSNYERAAIGWNGNEFEIKTESLGTGLGRPLVIDAEYVEICPGNNGGHQIGALHIDYRNSSNPKN